MLLLVFVVALAHVQAPASPAVIIDPDAYEIYAKFLPQPSERQTIPLVLQETTISAASCLSRAMPDAEWQTAQDDFSRKNGRVWLLRPVLPGVRPYRLTPRAEIDADDARLAIKYPGTRQNRPGSIDYLAVSAVGFNAAKTKAIVAVRERLSGGTYYLERRDGEWVSGGLDPCVWIF
jgi:hypothetical protein